jgi:hypothetical protein
MKTLFNELHLEEIKIRFQKLNADSVPRWGEFTAPRMVCHLVDVLEYTFGLKEGAKEPVAGPPMFIRHLIRLYLPFPKGKIKTRPEMLKTEPGQWEKDKRRVLELLNLYLENREKMSWPVHPFFGPLSGSAWAKLGWRHMNHHLSQFGV